MKAPVLVEVLRSLSAREFAGFGLFLKSPYYNKGDKTLALYNVLRSERNKGNEGIDKKYIYGKLYKDNNFNDEKLRKLFHDLSLLLDRYLALIEYEKDDKHRELLLLRSYRERKLKRPFIRQLENIRKAQKPPFGKNITYYKNMISLGYEEDIFYLESSLTNSRSALRQLEENIDHYFIISKLDLFRSMESDNYLVNKNASHNMWLKENILEYVERNIHALKKEHPLIYTEYLTYKLISESDADEFYYELKDFIKKKSKKLHPDDLRFLYSQMMNYCAMNYNNGKREFKKEMFGLIKTLEGKNSLFGENAHVEYLNAVTLALDLKQFAWGKRFIEQYKSKLDPKVKNDTYNLAMGKYYYSVKDLDNAINHLRLIGYMDFYYYFFVNRLMLKIYYEKKEYDGIISVIDAMKHFLARKEAIPDTYRSSNKKFIKYFNKLLTSKSREDKLCLRDKLNEEAPFAEKSWIIEKAGQES